MLGQHEDVIYYLTVGNENYPQAPIPEGAGEGILKGMYRLLAAEKRKSKRRIQLLGSGALLNEAVSAAKLLADDFDVQTDVWSVTSYQQLHRDGLAVDRRRRLSAEEPEEQAYVAECLNHTTGPIIAVSDYQKALPTLITPFLNRGVHVLGTDGYGRSGSREDLRYFFEVDRRHIAYAALKELSRGGIVSSKELTQARNKLGIEVDPCLDPATQ